MKLKKFEKPVRWNFKISVFGYGRNVKEALLEALNRKTNQIKDEYGSSVLIAIQDSDASN